MFFADSATALMAFKNGDIDMLIATQKDARALDDTGKYNIAVSRYGMTPFAVGDSKNPSSPFYKKEVRQAMSYAIDIKTLGDSLSYGYGVITNQWALPGTYAYNPNVVGYPYNPEKAKALIKSVYPDGFDCTLTYMISSDWNTNRCTAIGDYLGKVGVRVKLIPQQRAQYDLTATKGGWTNGICDMLTFTYPEIMNSMQQVLVKDSVKFPSMARAPGIEDLFNQAHAATDAQTKSDILQKMQKIMVDDYCMFSNQYIQGNICVKQKYVHDDMWYMAADQYLSGKAWIDK